MLAEFNTRRDIFIIEMGFLRQQLVQYLYPHDSSRTGLCELCFIIGSADRRGRCRQLTMY